MPKQLKTGFYDGTSFDKDELNKPRICFDNFVFDSDVYANNIDPEFNALAFKNPFTYDFAKPLSLPWVINIESRYRNEADYIGLAGHNLAGFAVVVEYSDDEENYHEATRATLVSNASTVIFFERKRARFWRVTFTGWATVPVFDLDFEAERYQIADYSESSPEDLFLSVLYLGKALAMPYKIYKGHAPGVLGPVNTFEANVSSRGQVLGRTLKRQQIDESFEFENLKPDWYREHFEPFRKAAITQPFFVSWRPFSYPSETVFGMSENIKPSNNGPRGRMSVSLQITGHRSESEG